ncbi:MAG TPA: hypothetical protein ENN84_03375 [Candidatus Marinimicrobia bacterium]|nr:hypothetical protein [Candidatus Neomarinimicrobiota bacterium]
MNESELMKHFFIEILTDTALSEIKTFIKSQPESYSLLILAAGLSDEELTLLDNFCPRSPLPIWGAIFPEIFIDNERKKHGTIIILLPYQVKCTYYSISEYNSSNKLQEECLLEKESQGTLFLFYDNVFQTFDGWFEMIYNYYGAENYYFGGGTGFLERPSLITSGGLKKDGILMAMLPVQGVIEKRHGWESCRGPFQVTQMQHNNLIELDWRPLSDVLEEDIPEEDSARLSSFSVSELSHQQSYVFGISKIGGEKLIRTGDYDSETGQINLKYPLPAGNFVYLMQENLHSMEAAAPLALLKAKDEMGEKQVRLSLFFDCALRLKKLPAKSLEKHFFNKQTIGVISQGQIACSGSDYPELLESTFCIALFH